jgi:polar amino acid transport system ATP-binding protein
MTSLEAPARSASVELRGIHVSFGTLEVLRGVDLTVGRGETACVIGPSGSGKSTLLRVANRLQEPDSGDLLLDGESVIHADPDRLRRRVGMVFQHFNLFGHRCVLDNITLPLRSVKRLSKADAEEIARARLAEVGLADKAPYRPGALSGGQQQRVAIARALAMDPEVMLFDEATSALDPELVKGVLDLMAGLAGRGLTLLVVTHEMGFARRVADKVAFMDRGRVVEAGPPEALFDDPRSPRLQRFLSQVL